MGKLAYEHPDNRACYPLRLCHNKDKKNKQTNEEKVTTYWEPAKRMALAFAVSYFLSTEWKTYREERYS